MRPGDTLSVVREPRTFTAFGALGNNTMVQFNKIGLTLEEGIGRAGGLLDLRSDPDGIFLLRFEPPSVVRDLVPARQIDRREKLIPVIYRLTLRDAKGYFLARSFAMRDKDVLYVANATGAELQKFLTLVTGVISPVTSIVTTAAPLASTLSAGTTVPPVTTTVVTAPPTAAPAAAAAAQGPSMSATSTPLVGNVAATPVAGPLQ
jgi:polysaccharide export outer membrane protein